jgi:hypothetical protein
MTVPNGLKNEFFGEEIQRLVKVLYSELYGIKGEDKNLSKIMESINEKVEVFSVS